MAVLYHVTEPLVACRSQAKVFVVCFGQAPTLRCVRSGARRGTVGHALRLSETWQLKAAWEKARADRRKRKAWGGGLEVMAWAVFAL